MGCRSFSYPESRIWQDRGFPMCQRENVPCPCHQLRFCEPQSVEWVDEVEDEASQKTSGSLSHFLARTVFSGSVVAISGACAERETVQHPAVEWQCMYGLFACTYTYAHAHTHTHTHTHIQRERGRESHKVHVRKKQNHAVQTMWRYARLGV